MIVRTAKTASGRFWRETGKTGNKPPENPPETRLVNFTCMHDYAARWIRLSFTPETGWTHRKSAHASV